jgi:hypothetical protein
MEGVSVGFTPASVFQSLLRSVLVRPGGQTFVKESLNSMLKQSRREFQPESLRAAKREPIVLAGSEQQNHYENKGH